MVARLLHACGLDLGPESDLMPPAQDNPDGFWENLRFVAINDELLNELGGAWDLPPRATPFTEERFEPIRGRARLLVSTFDRSTVWGWKDPRNSLTLPFWRTIVPGLRTVIIVRNPLEVAHSLQQRNGVSIHLALSLWEIYNRRALSATTRENRIVSHYDSFFADPLMELRRMMSFLGMLDSKAAEAAALISRERRHTHFSTQQVLDAQIPPSLFQLYQELSAEAGRVTDAELAASNLVSEGLHHQSLKDKASADALRTAPRPLPGAQALNVAVLEADKLRKQVAADTAEFERLNAHIKQISRAIHRAEEELKQRDATLAANNAAFQRLNAHIEQLSSAVHRAEEELEQRDATLAANNAEFQRLNAHIDKISAAFAEAERQRETEINQARERLTQTNLLLHSRSISLAETEARANELRTRFRQKLHDLKKLVRMLESVEDVAMRLRSSRRWKLANPIASLRNTISRNSEPVGYDHLDKVVAAYQRWRKAHPDMDDLAEQIQQLHRQADLKDSRAEIRATAAALSFREGNGDNGARASGPTEVVAPSAPKPIEFPIFDKVEVSIIIPVFNQFHFTQACLASLQKHSGWHAFEVIIVDDGSRDETVTSVPQMKGVVYLRNGTNTGFVGACNRGAGKARGEYLLFLNNDTIAKPGWLDALLETFQLEPRAGLVGSKLLFPDGRLQEAGSIIWRDGSGWNYGKFDDAGKPEYNYLRDVDYCSAACVMIPKSLFESVGGFDTQYAPGYYEDTDLSFKVRQNGYKVLYQPLSEIIHYEGATGGTDVSSGAKRYQNLNRTAFATRWAAELAVKPADGDVASYFKCKPGQKRILVIDHHLPMPEKDAGSLRMFHILTILRDLGHRVTFVPDNLADIPPYADELRKRGIEVVHHPYIESVRQHLSQHGREYDAVVLSRCNFARKHVADVRLHAPQSRLIFDTVDLQFLRESREAEMTRDAQTKLSAQEKEQQEYELIDQSDETWVVSSFEQELLHRERPDKSIEIVSMITDLPGSATPFSLRHDFLFVGSFQHAPNADAVIFFSKEIYPLVKAWLPYAKFYIIGDKPPPAVVALADENIVVTGLQPDIRPYFDNVKLSIAPLRFGAGVKGKITQSMGFGVPVVATSIAAEGMALTNREDILVADRPDDFAKALVEVYQCEKLWNQISENGIKKARAMYSREVARKQLSRLFNCVPLHDGNGISASKAVAHAEL
jgi:O-antigen biosynthesis protein